ncbi:hypothetical protein SDC9_167701 [bioreactor metagenome]|uniref:Uncharacterized protein n=1 Tax=bioreactor metagenome TaxID=1076179 RepID=A0A645G8S2_9ZZZZ
MEVAIYITMVFCKLVDIKATGVKEEAIPNIKILFVGIIVLKYINKTPRAVRKPPFDI